MKTLTLAFLSIVLLQGCALSASGAISTAEKNFANKNYKQALYDINRAESWSEGNDSRMPKILFLKGQIIARSNINEGIAILEYLRKKYPDSQEAFRAKEKIIYLEKMS